MRTLASLLLLCVLVFGTGCQSDREPLEAPPQVTPSAAEATFTPELLSLTQEETQMPHSQPMIADPELQNLIALIAQDLANRLSVAPDEFSLVEATAVEWSDSSLDCPQEGMSYLPVITPGYRIVLQANDQTYAYHTNRDGYFVLCNNRLPPIMPQPTG